MQPEIETRASKAENGWRDQDGFVGPFKPGNGPRTDPRGRYPTGPDIGEQMPDVHCATEEGTPFKLHEHRGNKPTVFIFFRSAVW